MGYSTPGKETQAFSLHTTGFPRHNTHFLVVLCKNPFHFSFHILWHFSFINLLLKSYNIQWKTYFYWVFNVSLNIINKQIKNIYFHLLIYGKNYILNIISSLLHRILLYVLISSTSKYGETWPNTNLTLCQKLQINKKVDRLDNCNNHIPINYIVHRYYFHEIY